MKIVQTLTIIKWEYKLKNEYYMTEGLNITILYIFNYKCFIQTI